MEVLSSDGLVLFTVSPDGEVSFAVRKDQSSSFQYDMGAEGLSRIGVMRHVLKCLARAQKEFTSLWARPYVGDGEGGTRAKWFLKKGFVGPSLKGHYFWGEIPQGEEILQSMQEFEEALDIEDPADWDPIIYSSLQTVFGDKAIVVEEVEEYFSEIETPVGVFSTREYVPTLQMLGYVFPN